MHDEKIKNATDPVQVHHDSPSLYDRRASRSWERSKN